MARIVRPMKKDPQEPALPLVAPRFACLGIRPGEVEIEENGIVVVNRRGMSVTRCWRGLPPELIPEELDDGYNGARGSKMAVFVHGQDSGPFAEGPVALGLEMCFKENSHDGGVVRPVAPVPESQYVADLVATRSDWVIDQS